jgi:hypothetical protein
MQQVDTLLDTWESYTGFCYKHQFSPTLRERVKSRLYFLASQTWWEWAVWRPQHVAAVLPSGGPLLDKVKAHPIKQPDLAVILRVLENLSMDGSMDIGECGNDQPGFGVHSVSQKLSANNYKRLLELLEFLRR